MNKRSQSGMNAALLVAIIAGLIIVYILFLPAEDRERLLENKTTKEKSGEEEENILLKESPGRIDIIEETEDKVIPNVFLFEATNAKELERINAFEVRDGVFDKKSKTVVFGLDNLENTESVLLSFLAKKHKGTLIIKLNGNIIYENEIESVNVNPVKLDKSLLEKDNELEFSVSSVGWRFWKTNEYSLDDIKITGDITDRSRQESRNVFTLTASEINNLEKATLRFIPYCKNVKNVGLLDVLVNNQKVYSAVPVCDDPVRQPIPLAILDEGENNVIFKTSKGSYSVEQIGFDLKLEETKSVIYYFEINESQFGDIEDGDKEIELTIKFVDDDENKRADLSINGHLKSIDQDEPIYSKIIMIKDLREGNNYIEIRPRVKLEIVEIRVELV